MIPPGDLWHQAQNLVFSPRLQRAFLIRRVADTAGSATNDYTRIVSHVQIGRNIFLIHANSMRLVRSQSAFVQNGREFIVRRIGFRAQLQDQKTFHADALASLLRENKGRGNESCDNPHLQRGSILGGSLKSKRSRFVGIAYWDIPWGFR